MRSILITGALGQIGTELSSALINKFGTSNVILSDLREFPKGQSTHSNNFVVLDCTDFQIVQDVVRRYNVGQIYHLAALLSATSEAQPKRAWYVNMNGLQNVLEVARDNNCAVFFPSSIGAFGPLTPKLATPQDTIQRPNTMYGITKVSGELLCDYYALRFGTDCRGLRLPGLISNKSIPSGGTTDYATEIFHHAISSKHYTCYLKPNTRLDMMYMRDAIQAILDLMSADQIHLKHRNAFNIAAINVTPEELAQEIKIHIPEFVIEYEIDPIRQAIADSWPKSVDDSQARSEWGWKPMYDLGAMTQDMIKSLSKRLQKFD